MDEAEKNVRDIQVQRPGTVFKGSLAKFHLQSGSSVVHTVITQVFVVSC